MGDGAEKELVAENLIRQMLDCVGLFRQQTTKPFPDIWRQLIEVTLA